MPSTSKTSFNCHGQGVLEALLALPLVLLVLSGLFMLSERTLWYTYGDHILYETLVCSLHESPSACTRQGERALMPLNFTSRKYSLRIKQSSTKIYGELTISMSPNLCLSKELRRP